MKLDAQLAQALANLLQNGDFKVFLSALGDDAEFLMEKLVMMPTDQEVDVVRGQARQLSLILKAVAEAPSVLNRLKQQTEGKH